MSETVFVVVRMTPVYIYLCFLCDTNDFNSTAGHSSLVGSMYALKARGTAYDP